MTQDLTFTQWMLAVNRSTNSLAQVSTDDFDDYDYYDAYSDGASPEEIAREALDAAGFPFDEGNDDFDTSEIQAEYDQRWPQLNEDQGYNS